MRRLSIILVAVLAAAFTAGCASLSGTVPVVHDAVYPAGALAVLQLENQNGDVAVTGWDRDEIQVRALNGRFVSNVSVETVGDRMTVRTLSAAAPGVGGVRADYEIRVPRALPRLELVTQNGRIEIDGCDGIIDADTSNGEIQLAGTETFERLSTSNGPVGAEVRSLGTDALVTTSNAAVRILVAPSINATIDARTSNGRVTVSGVALNATVAGQGELAGTIGTGGNTLRIETSNADITLGAL